MTLLDCDRIIVFEEGKIVEEGSPADLMQRQDGIFATMVNVIERDDGQRWLPKNEKSSNHHRLDTI